MLTAIVFWWACGVTLCVVGTLWRLDRVAAKAKEIPGLPLDTRPLELWTWIDVTLATCPTCGELYALRRWACPRCAMTRSGKTVESVDAGRTV